MTRCRIDHSRLTGTAYPSGTPEFTPGFSGVPVTRSLVLYACFVDHCLSFCTVSFVHCVVCSSSIYGFWLPLWYLQTLLFFWLKNEERPECIACNSNYSLKHVLLDCVDVSDIRQTFYNVHSIFDLFTNVAVHTILKFKPQKNVYTKI